MNSILIGLYKFDGPNQGNNLKEEAGVYAVLHYRNGQLDLIDLQESPNIKNHWQRLSRYYRRFNYPGKILIATHYMPGLSKSERQRVRSEITQECRMLEQLAS